MIPFSKLKVAANTWQDELKTANISLGELLKTLHLSTEDFAFIPQANSEFKLKVPPAFLAKIKPGTINDPLLKQILPSSQELIAKPGFSKDPVDEAKANQVSGLIRKYQSRALLLTSSVCPLHCRYCFRRNFAYKDNLNLAPAIAALKLDKSIYEVILSGGDPLSLSNARLKTLIRELEDISHIKTLRIHTRFPVAVPRRMDKTLLNIFAASRFNIILVSHINHPQEIDNLVIESLKPFRAAVNLLNQSVLLSGVNDNAKVMIRLSKTLIQAGITPYYLHLLDQVNGAAHFKVSKIKAREIIQKMQDKLPGYLVPKLVREIPGRASKTIIPGR